MNGYRVVVLTEPERRALIAALDGLDPSTLPKIALHAVAQVAAGIYYPAPPKFIHLARKDQEREQRKTRIDGK